jgi:hypothetical protein
MFLVCSLAAWSVLCCINFALAGGSISERYKPISEYLDSKNKTASALSAVPLSMYHSVCDVM